MSTSSSGRRRVASKLYTAEDEAFNQIAKEAEARLAAKRHARAEAREIRMRELEKMQREADEQSDRQYELLSDRRPAPEVVRTPSRRSSEDSTDTSEGRTGSRDLKLQVQELEERFRRAMVSNAQLDDEKSAYIYRVETLKDELEEAAEGLVQAEKECQRKKRLLDQLERDYKSLQQDKEFLLYSLRQRDQLIEDHGLVLLNDVMNGDVSDELAPAKHKRKTRQNSLTHRALFLEPVGDGSLDVRLKKFVEEKQELLDEIFRLRSDLESARAKKADCHLSNGPDARLAEMHREASRQASDYKFRLKKADQEIAALQSNLCRLESQSARYRTAAENAEKTEDELKAEKRKILRELRESQSRIEELETSNTHLQKRIDKLKSARSALCKS